MEGSLAGKRSISAPMMSSVADGMASALSGLSPTMGGLTTPTGMPFPSGMDSGALATPGKWANAFRSPSLTPNAPFGQTFGNSAADAAADSRR